MQVIVATPSQAFPATAPATDPLVAALALRAGGDLDRAIATLLPHAILTPDGLMVALTLGKLYSEVGDLTRAGRWLHQAARIAPTSFDVRLAVALYRAQLGHFQHSANELLQIVDDAHAAVGRLDPRESAVEIIALADIGMAAYANSARVFVEAGAYDYARQVAESELTSKDDWEWAHAVMADVVDRQGLDPFETARDGLARKVVSPLMVEYLLQTMFENDPSDLAALDAVVRQADAAFGDAFAWWMADEGLTATLEALRQQALVSMMRGSVTPESVARLLRPLRDLQTDADAWLAPRLTVG